MNAAGEHLVHASIHSKSTGNDDFDMGIDFIEDPEYFAAIHAGHDHVQNYQVNFGETILIKSNGFIAAGGRHDFKVKASDHFRAIFLNEGFVLDQQKGPPADQGGLFHDDRFLDGFIGSREKQ